MPGNSPKDHSEDGDNNDGQKGDPEGSAHEELGNVGFAYAQRPEWRLRGALLAK